ncbi:hypothetical protein QWY85_02725 [Neolewinella lacunae]|uniref:Uncharacterized protein n=1 Tax=Neolewinella lacunae TaxID=1517758 RepID=A0A923PHF7_9BACT|nr:hypothetical protein [Neolewinella lacunae]MBC6992675.1 hypothetical protein [Neolewinella lacunae]MDN3633555.1 hypothetical protein [Neolewinella lacunae]
MTKQTVARLGGRPVFLARYEPVVPPTDFPATAPTARAEEEDKASAFRIREHFPAVGPDCDGHCYRITFAAGRLERTYDMILTFLQEQGYANVPVPGNIQELRKFRLPPKLRHQLSLFGEDGYVHNPIKILFPSPAGRRGELCLELYNEAAPDHLLKFHRRI